MSIQTDVQSLEPGAIVELFVLDTTSLGGIEYRFHSGLNELKAPVTWQGELYTPFPIEAEGFEMTAKGTMPTPTIRVANITGMIGAMCLSMSDMLGATLIRKRTFVKYLDAVNFSSGNVTADPLAHFPDEIWRINRKVNENKVMVEFELASAMDVQGVTLPRRQIIANTCTWKYKSPECGYTGVEMFTAMDSITSDPALDRCGKRLVSCSLRFGVGAELPYGGFPAVGKIR